MAQTFTPPNPALAYDNHEVAKAWTNLALAYAEAGDETNAAAARRCAVWHHAHIERLPRYGIGVATKSTHHPDIAVFGGKYGPFSSREQAEQEGSNLAGEDDLLVEFEGDELRVLAVRLNNQWVEALSPSLHHHISERTQTL